MATGEKWFLYSRKVQGVFFEGGFASISSVQFFRIVVFRIICKRKNGDDKMKH